MKNIYQKTIILFSALLACFLTIGAAHFGKNALTPQQAEEVVAVFSTADYGSLSPVVIDAKTDAPISNATIYIPETGKAYKTDENGAVGTISVPILRDNRYDDILPKDWGEITLLVYGEGYAPYGLFYLRIKKNETRIGPRIYLYAEESFRSEIPFTVIENPDDNWAAALLKKYQPKEN